MTRSIIFAVLLSWTTLCGCTTYVNIPAQRGDFARHNPNTRAVQAVLIESLQAVAKAHPVKGSFALILPEHTTVKTYDVVTKKTGKQAVWPGNRDRVDLPILEVKQILIRRQEALVDIVRTFHGNDEQKEGDDPEGFQEENQRLEQLITVELQWHPLQGWLALRVRPWKLNVETAFWANNGDETD